MERLGSMKILYATSVDISLSNGPGVNEREFTLALHAKMGDRCHFVLPRPSREIQFEVPSGLVHYSKNHGQYRPIAFAAHVASQAFVLGQLLKQQRFDLAVCRLGLFPWVDMAWLNRRGIPYAVKTLEDSGSLRIQKGVKGAIGKLVAPFDNALVRRAAQGAFAIDVSTPEFIPYHVARLGISAEKMQWIDNAVSTKRFFPMPTATVRRELGMEGVEPILGYIGGRCDERGGKQILQVLARLAQAYPKAGAIVAGGGCIEDLRRLARRLGVEDRCNFPGQVPYEQAPRYINAFDIGFAFDLATRTSAFGNSSQKIRQYVACGKPVVASLHSNPFLAEYGLGTTVSASDVDGICEAVLGWLAMPEQEKVLHSERAVRYAREKLSVDAMLEKRLAFWAARLASGRIPIQNDRASL